MSGSYNSKQCFKELHEYKVQKIYYATFLERLLSGRLFPNMGFIHSNYITPYLQVVCKSTKQDIAANATSVDSQTC
jgi:hypothetical protein